MKPVKESKLRGLDSRYEWWDMGYEMWDVRFSNPTKSSSSD
jgi:hypothetical protein